MTFCLRLLSVALLTLWGFAALASQPVEWSDLPDPAAQDFEDPFRELSAEQFDDLRFALRLRGRLQQDVGSAD